MVHLYLIIEEKAIHDSSVAHNETSKHIENTWSILQYHCWNKIHNKQNGRFKWLYQI